MRVRALIEAQELASERLIGWVQLVVVLVFAVLYFIARRPTDAPERMLAEPVPLALGLYFLFTLARLILAYRGRLPGSIVILSILVDTFLLLALIWSFHGQYGQPAAFSLKVPTFIYMFVFIALRALRFDPRYVLTAGLAAAAGWLALFALVVLASGPDALTRNFAAYINGNHILAGAEFDKVFTILMVTAVLTIAVWRARQMLVTAVSEEAAVREIRRFLSGGVADVITRADTVLEAGQVAEREAAIVMLDIRGFTRFSTQVRPDAVVAMLTSLHARIVPLIERHNGVVDKFLGDGIMATFGAVEPSPTAAADALTALDAIMAEAELWRVVTARRNGGAPLDVNGAAAGGTVVFATLGTAERLEYTVIGEAVNLAAKLEKHNKVEGTRALTTAALLAAAERQGYRPAPEREQRRGRAVAGLSAPIDLVVVTAGAAGKGT
ncbi:MAG: adenylate/guanylate cyclase domain-containing protein [Hyphomicrobiaceae bacterium]|nr:adenylate/guanylate cyclase domain-containing protein [Hyphomicrobiaceae bacterium]